MILLSADTCIKALNGAALNRKSAFQMELAVGLGIFLARGGASREARDVLNQAYAGAGYDCQTITGIDYKTINRRINATAALYEKLPVKKWVGKHVEATLLSAICTGLEPYEFFTVVDVQRYCSPERMLPRRSITPVAPAPEALTVPEHASSEQQQQPTGQATIMQMLRRASDHPTEGQRLVEVGHLVLVIPQEAEREELIAMARKLLEMAADKELLTA